MHRLSQFVLFSVLVFLTHASKLTHEFGKRQIISDTPEMQADDGKEPLSPILPAPLEIPVDNASVVILVPSPALTDNATVDAEENLNLELMSVETNFTSENANLSTSNNSIDVDNSTFIDSSNATAISVSSENVVSSKATEEVESLKSLNSTQQISKNVSEFDILDADNVTSKSVVLTNTSTLEGASGLENSTTVEVEGTFLNDTQKFRQDTVTANITNTTGTVKEFNRSSTIEHAASISRIISKFSQQIDEALSEATTAVTNTTSDTNVTDAASELMLNLTANVNDAIQKYIPELDNMTAAPKVSDVVFKILDDVNRSVSEVLNQTDFSANITAEMNVTDSISDTLSNITILLEEALNTATAKLENVTEQINVTTILSQVLANINESITQNGMNEQTDILIETLTNAILKHESLLKSVLLDSENGTSLLTIVDIVSDALTSVSQSVGIFINETIFDINGIISEENITEAITEVLSNVTQKVDNALKEAIFNLTSLKLEMSTDQQLTHDRTITIDPSTSINLTINSNQADVILNESTSSVDILLTESIISTYSTSGISTETPLAKTTNLEGELNVQNSTEELLNVTPPDGDLVKEELGTIYSNNFTTIGFSTDASFQMNSELFQSSVVNTSEEVSQELANQKTPPVSITTMPIYSTTSLARSDEDDRPAKFKSVETKKNKGTDTDSESDNDEEEDDKEKKTTTKTTRASSDTDTDSDND